MKNNQELELLKKEMIKLEEEILKHDRLYALDMPEISDTEYDKLYSRLVDLEEQYPELANPESPTQKIIDEDITGFEKVKHKHPILSQKKAYTNEDVLNFIDRVSIYDSVKVIRTQNKIDGLTIVLDYEDGILVKGSSRGNGTIGFDITHLVKHIENIPKTISNNASAQIRGEGVIFKSDFIRINEEVEKSGQTPFASARNLASGTMKSLDGEMAKKRCMKFIAFDVLESSYDFKNDDSALKFLENEGFTVVESSVFDINDTDNLLKFLNEFNDKHRQDLEYTIDGIVLKIDDFEARKLLGETVKTPRWSCAFKFKSEQSETQILDVIWQVGRTGAITPVAVIKPTEIDGRVVRRASLANQDNIIEKDLKINDFAMVRFAGEVIPQITESIPSKRTGNETDITPPHLCPICNHEVTVIKENKKEKTSTKVLCKNKNCLARTEAKLIHFASKDNINIQNLGKSLITKLVNLGMLEKIEDIYTLKDKKDELLSLDKMGEKRVNTILQNIENSKNMPLDKVISALGIPNIGNKKATIIADYFKTMDNILEFNKKPNKKEELLNLEDFGDIVSDSFISYFEDDANLKLINNLKNFGFSMKKEELSVPSELVDADKTNVEGKKFVITGTLSIKRNDMKAKIMALGGKVIDSVSNNTDYLILGKDKEGSSKHKKAISLNIPILSEEDFNNMI